MEERELLNKLKEKNEDSFRIIIDKYQKMVLNSCYRFVLNKETAEDLTQEVFIEVYRSINMFRSESKFSTWIYRIAISKSLDYLKSRKRKKRFAILKSITENETSKNKFEQIPENENPSLQTLLENEDRIKILAAAVDKLPENQKVAFTLSKYDEMSYQDISEILGVSVSSVESLIHRAKVNLRKKLYKFYKEIM
jgi:RNA polymerase sigma-70 factor, ECF subfamily